MIIFQIELINIKEIFYNLMTYIIFQHLRSVNYIDHNFIEI